MEHRKMVFCTKCGFLGSIESNEALPICPDCKCSLVDVDYLQSDWKELDQNQKEKLKKQWIADDKKRQEIYQQKLQEQRQNEKEISKIMVTSGYNFEGYKIVKYSGYISGDDVIQIKRESGTWIFNSTITDVGAALTQSLSKIRSQALKELKEAAFDLGCNAVIGVDFDYITLDPETNVAGTTAYLPYVFCVTANGTAVKIEKE